MTGPAYSSAIDLWLQEVVIELRTDGWVVDTDPDALGLPSPLRDLQVDITAHRGQEILVGKIVGRHSASRERLDELAKRVAAIPNARLDAYWIGDLQRRPDSARGIGLQGQAERTLQTKDLEELLSALRDAAPGSGRPLCRVETGRAALDLLAIREATGFNVFVAITSSGHPARTSAATIALEVNGEHFVAGLTPEGTVTFRNIPAGEWILHQVRRGDTPPGEVPGLALPLPRLQVGLAAARSVGGTAVLRVVLPDAGTRLILHRERNGDYLLEVDRNVETKVPQVIAVSYGRIDAAQGFVVIPARHSGLARLAGYSPTSPWQASQATPAQILALDADSVAASIRAAVNNVTKHAWREIGDTEPELRQLIERELGG